MVSFEKLMKQQADEMVHNEMSSKLVKQVDEMTTQ
jgi:hypothetical protein